MIGVGIPARLVDDSGRVDPAACPLATPVSDRARAEAIVARYGRQPLDFFKLWPDKSHFFSPVGRCVIAYQVAWRVAVSLGDPAGPDAALEPTAKGFLKYCADHEWRAAFHQVGEAHLPVYRRLGLQALKVGEVGVVDLAHFRSETVHRRDFRKILHKFQGSTYTFARSVPPHGAILLDEARQVSDEWLSLPGRRERGFTVGRFERGYVSRTPLVTLRDARGRLLAFVNEVPSFRPEGSTVDLMRHRLEIPNGAVDYLLTSLLLDLEHRGYQWFSLGLAPLAGVGGGVLATAEERAAHFLFEYLNGFFSYKGLRHYKAKFEPRWEDVFLVYQGGIRGLVQTALALRRLTEGPRPVEKDGP